MPSSTYLITVIYLNPKVEIYSVLDPTLTREKLLSNKSQFIILYSPMTTKGLLLHKTEDQTLTLGNAAARKQQIISRDYYPQEIRSVNSRKVSSMIPEMKGHCSLNAAYGSVMEPGHRRWALTVQRKTKTHSAGNHTPYHLLKGKQRLQ